MRNKKSHKVLIVGIGSPFGDDQFGWLVAKNIQERLIAKHRVDVEIVDRPGLNLLRFLEQGYQKIILIDAVNAGLRIGEILCLKANEISKFIKGSLSSHHIGVAPSLALANALNMNISHVIFYGVQGERLFVKDGQLSQMVEDAISPMVSKIYYEHVLHS
ncbi:hydrogenase maturation protease [Fastidiosibacter lacustris]|uniref:hydrogenase maturation protease n=1 Tax=Fastidiosibacter lacustris TaxID=2056695 RepID=UPI000E356E46|nr:hydrogenase maturation protease [Fastidiosibacter lacustris]